MERQTRLIDSPVLEVTDQGLVSLFTELEFATKTVRREQQHSIWAFLVQCHYPFGSGRWYPIGKDNVVPGGLLARKIGKFEADSQIALVCDEIARMKNSSLEAISGMTMYVFLDRYLPNFEKKFKRRVHDPRNW